MLPKTILYVEEDRDMVDLVSEIMSYESYRVIADCGRHVYQLLKQHPIGLILISEDLEWTWGSDLCHQLKGSAELQQMPIVLISGTHDIAAVSGRCGANGYIQKPFDMYDVIDVVHKLFKTPLQQL